MFSQKLSQLPVCGVEVRVVKAPALGASSRLLLIASEIVRAVPAIECAFGDLEVNKRVLGIVSQSQPGRSAASNPFIV